MRHIRSILILLSIISFGLQAAEELEGVFTHIYEQKLWGEDAEGKGCSGAGSTVAQAAPYMQFLQEFIKTNNIQSVVDLGCGDWTFSQHLNWDAISYTGIDLVASVIDENREKFKKNGVAFFHGNFLTMDLPQADLLICKDVLQHLPNSAISQFLQKLSQYKYCLITNDVDPNTMTSQNLELPILDHYRNIDLTSPPFSLNGKKVLTYRSGYTVKQVLLLEHAR